MTHINTFNKGLETDVSPDLVPPSKYIDGENFRIIIGEDNGLMITAGNGPKKLINIPSDYKIIGLVNIKDNVVIFFKSINTTTNSHYICKIPISNLISLDNKIINDFNSNDINLNVILSSKSLKLYDELSYVINIENDELHYLYFTSYDLSDNKSPVYRINILESYGYIDNQENILLFNNDLIESPQIERIEQGSLKCGTYRYAYQLFDLNGSETAYSGLSDSVLITDSNPENGSLSFSGNLSSDAISGKSIVVKIPSLPVDKYVRIVRLHYKDALNFPICYIVYEGKMDKNTDFIFEDYAYNNIVGTSSIDEVSLPYTPITAKFLETKNNYLFFGSVTEEHFDIDIDTRAYRWNKPDNPEEAKTCKLIEYNTNYEMILNENNLSYINPKNFEDCYSSFNIPMENNYDYNYRYNLEGKLGGEGKHVKYEFISYPIKIHDPYNEDYYVSEPLFWTNSFDEYSPISSSKVVPIGYQRDEIYRFGVIFFNDKGQKTPVKWIDDIRFPRIFEEPYLIDKYNNRIAHIIGVKFTFKNLPSEIKGYQIVRALRTRENSTIIDAGILNYYIKHDQNYYYYLNNVPPENNLNSPLFNNGGPITGVLTKDTILNYVSPELLYYPNEYKNLGTHINITGFFDKTAKHAFFIHYTYINYNDLSDHEASYSPVAMRLKPKIYYDEPSLLTHYNNYEHLEIVFKKHYEPVLDVNKSSVNVGGIQIRPRTGKKDENEKEYRRGYNGSALVLKVTFDGDSKLYYSSLDPLYVYRKQNIYPYGGPTRNARDNTKYIPCSEVVKINGSTTSSVDVYNGDTFIGIFEYMYATVDSNIQQKLRQPVLIQTVVESKINLWYTSDNKITKKYPNKVEATNKQIDPFDDYPDKLAVWTTQEKSGIYDVNTDKTKKYVQPEDLYLYNSAYSSIDSKIYYYIKSQFQSNVNNFPVRINKSPKKFNNALSDTWSRINTSDYLDLEIKYGNITGITQTNSGLIVFQNKGISLIPIEERSLITDSNNNELYTGKSKALDRYDYISTTYGISNFKHFKNTPNAIYFIDVNNKIIGRITNKIEVISKESGIQKLLYSLLNNNNEITIIPNNKYNEVWFCINEKTLLFSEINNAFISKLDSVFKNGNSFNNYSFGFNNDNLYILDEGQLGHYKIDSLGNLNSSTFLLEFVVNPGNGTLNRLDTLLINGIIKGVDVPLSNYLFDKLRVRNNYQDTYDINNPSMEFRFRSWRINYIRTAELERLIDYYNIVKVSKDFSNETFFVIKTVFSENIPIFNR